MKVAGRKTSAAYELYGFIPRVDNGKHSAICTLCNRILQNTAVVRLQKHRKACLARNSGGGTSHVPNIEIQTHIKTKPGTAVTRNDDVNSSIKAERSNMEFDDANINDNAHDNTTYEDTAEATSPPKLRRNTSHDEINKTSVVLSKSREPSNTLQQEQNPIQSPVMTQQQPLEPFESYHATTIANDKNSALDNDDNIEEINDEDLINIEEELDVIQNLMPRSRESMQLQDELSKAEAEYFRCKAAYFKKLTENCKVKRTLMLLESRKLQLEIERLTNEF